MPKMMNVTLVGQCPFCRKDWEVTVTEKEYDDWRFGDMLIQEALRDHTPEERECLISGLCVECQKKIFKEF